MGLALNAPESVRCAGVDAPTTPLYFITLQLVTFFAQTPIRTPASNELEVYPVTLQNWFWGIYVLTLVLGLWTWYEPTQPIWYRRAGSFVVLMVLIGLLGYEVFGSVIKR